MKEVLELKKVVSKQNVESTSHLSKKYNNNNINLWNKTETKALKSSATSASLTISPQFSQQSFVDFNKNQASFNESNMQSLFWRTNNSINRIQTGASNFIKHEKTNQSSLLNLNAYPGGQNNFSPNNSVNKYLKVQQQRSLYLQQLRPLTMQLGYNNTGNNNGQRRASQDNFTKRHSSSKKIDINIIPASPSPNIKSSPVAKLPSSSKFDDQVPQNRQNYPQQKRSQIAIMNQDQNKTKGISRKNVIENQDLNSLGLNNQMLSGKNQKTKKNLKYKVSNSKSSKALIMHTPAASTLKWNMNDSYELRDTVVDIKIPNQSRMKLTKRAQSTDVMQIQNFYKLGTLKKTNSSDHDQSQKIGMNRAQTLSVGSRTAEGARRRQLDQLKKTIKKHYNRDHSVDSDFNTTNSYRNDSTINDSKSNNNHDSAPSNTKQSNKIRSLQKRLTMSLGIQKGSSLGEEGVLFDVMYSNDINRLKEILSQFQSQYERQKKLNVRDKYKRTPLFYAVYHNSYELVNLLLQQGADTLYSDNLGRTVIHYAAINGASHSIVQLLIDYNDKMNSEQSHTEEAVVEHEKRKPNQYDMPQKGRPVRLQVLPGLGLFGQLNTDQVKERAAASVQQKVPYQPMTSTMKKSKDGLDKNKLIAIQAEAKNEIEEAISNPNNLSVQRSRKGSNAMMKSKDDTYEDIKIITDRTLGNEEEKEEEKPQYESRLLQVSQTKQLPQKSRPLKLEIKGRQQLQVKTTSQQQLTQDEKEQNELMEKRIKRTKGYMNGCKKLINLTDNKGKTALHYAAHYQNIDLIKYLIKQKAITIIRDYQLRKPIDMTTISDIKDFIENDEQKFFEKYAGGHFDMRKGLIKDQMIGGANTQKNASNFTSQSQTKKAGVAFSGGFTQSLGLIDSEVDSDDGSQSKGKSNNRRFKKKIQLDNNELASLSDIQLTQYNLGIYKDNALTYKMRFQDKDNFIYLLIRGISPLAEDKGGNNCIHYAIQMERLDYLCFLMEGTFTSSLTEINNVEDQNTISDHDLIDKAQFLAQIIQFGKYPWILSSLMALDNCNKKEGNSVLHMAIEVGNDLIFNYLVLLLKIRQKMRHIYTSIYGIAFKDFRLAIEFKNKNDNTPLSFCAFKNQGQYFKTMVDLGANWYTSCRTFNNILHYAVHYNNKQMIEAILYSDAEGNRLSQEQNIKGQTPLDLDTKVKYDIQFNNIWVVCSISGKDALERLEWLVTTNQFSVNQKTLVGKNTPLHFAVIYENLKAVDFLCKQTGIQVNEKNNLGQTPIDLAMLIPRKKLSQRIIDFVSKRLTDQQAIKNYERGQMSPNRRMITSDNNPQTQPITISFGMPRGSPVSKKNESSQNSKQGSPFNSNNNGGKQFRLSKLKQNSSSSSLNQIMSKDNGFTINTQKVPGIVVETLRQNQTIKPAGALNNEANNYSISDDNDELMSQANIGYSTASNFDDYPQRFGQTLDKERKAFLIQEYDHMISLKDQIGFFSADIFIKWKLFITKKDEVKKNDYRDIFKILDDKKKGVIKVECLLWNIDKLGTVFASEAEVKRFEIFIDRYYKETKVSEEGFVKLIIEFKNK